MQDLWIVILVSYLLGSIPFGLVFAKLLCAKDLRAYGSGNIGATNATRVGGKRLGALTLLFDAMKGVIAVFVAKILASNVECIHYMAAIFTVLGHVFPIWLKFKGGKGVATSIAVILLLHWKIGIAMALAWLFIYKIVKISSLSSMFAILFASVVAVLLSDLSFVMMMCFLTVLILFKHQSNIKNLVVGKEE